MTWRYEMTLYVVTLRYDMAFYVVTWRYDMTLYVVGWRYDMTLYVVTWRYDMTLYVVTWSTLPLNKSLTSLSSSLLPTPASKTVSGELWRHADVHDFSLEHSKHEENTVLYSTVQYSTVQYSTV